MVAEGEPSNFGNQPLRTRLTVAQPHRWLRDRIKIRWSVQVLKDAGRVQRDFRYRHNPLVSQPVKSMALRDLIQVVRDGPRHQHGMSALTRKGWDNGDWTR
jgi:hypothetical protein